MRPEIEQVAADWLARRAAGLSGPEEAAFRRWLAADAQHAAVYRELEATWRLLDGVRETVPPDARPDPDALALRRRRGVFWLAPLLAAAAAVALAYIGWWRPAQPPDLHHAEEVVTAVGSIQKLTLPDGSVVRLNTDSRVHVAYAAGERRVRLIRGEAHFTVAKDPDRPFFVEAGGVAVRAVGTAFNVRLQRDAIEVLVTEGQVRVDDTVRGETMLARREPKSAPLLVAGERALIPAATIRATVPATASVRVPAVAVSADEIERTLAWRERRLEFVAVPLAEIVTEFNRYNRSRLAVDDPVLAARRFGGSFRADEPETFVRLLETRFGIRTERRGDATVLRAAR
jgi:transmembrane sensor